jgi:hypothetical protein
MKVRLPDRQREKEATGGDRCKSATMVIVRASGVVPVRIQTGIPLSLPERCGSGRRICTVVEVAPDPGNASCVCQRAGESRCS